MMWDIGPRKYGMSDIDPEKIWDVGSGKVSGIWYIGPKKFEMWENL